MENAYQEVLSQIPDGADDYTKVMTVYTYVIDNTEYVISDDDQSIAGAFWKKQAVCAGYAGAVQYLLERLDIPSRFVNGLRYTDEETIEIVQMVLSGKTNKDLVSLIEQLGGTAIGMCGIDAGMIQAKKLEGDYGYVGRVMPRCWQSIRQQSMIICVRSHRSTRRIIRPLMSFLFLRVQRLT